MSPPARMFIAAALALAVLGSRGRAAEEPAIALRADNEDGKKVLVATVTAAGQPVENAKVVFFARRTFGALSLGAEVTLDDGTAAVPFPATLPGDTCGRLQLSAQLANRSKTAAPVRVESVFEGGAPFRAGPPADPRALWASRAPLVLLANIAVIVGLIWGAFAYAVYQLAKIRNASAVDGVSAAARIFSESTSSSRETRS